MTTLKEDLDARWRTKSKLTKAVVEVAAIIIVFVLTIGILALVTGKAHATCSPSGDTCPAPATFAHRYHNHKIRHAHGLPVKRAWVHPAKARHIFRGKFQHFFNHHPKWQAKLREHYEGLESSITGKVASRGGGNIPLSCQLQNPMSTSCMSWIAWEDMNLNAGCAAANGYPSKAYDACTKWYGNGKEEWPSWNEVRTGIKLAACTVATGASIVVAVGSDGLGAPALFAITTGIGCGVAYWEAFG